LEGRKKGASVELSRTAFRQTIPYDPFGFYDYDYYDDNHHHNRLRYGQNRWSDLQDRNHMPNRNHNYYNGKNYNSYPRRNYEHRAYDHYVDDSTRNPYNFINDNFNSYENDDKPPSYKAHDYYRQKNQQQKYDHYKHNNQQNYQWIDNYSSSDYYKGYNKESYDPYTSQNHYTTTEPTYTTTTRRRNSVNFNNNNSGKLN
jgi:hypothetical protein